MKHTVSYDFDKCINPSYEEGDMRVTGGFLTKILNIQNRRFTFVSCTECGYTEFYKRQNSGVIANVIDLFTN